MRISTPCVVALTWTLQDALGEVLDQLDEPIEFLLGAHDLLPKIEESLQGLGADQQIQLHLEPEHAFGEYNEALIFLEPRKLFSDPLEEGMIIEAARLPEGCSPDMPAHLSYMVSGLYPEHVVLDGNHPLAGIALRLQLQIEHVRPATAQEMQKGTLGVGFFKLTPESPLVVAQARLLH